jgi:hypothetical protein
MTTVSVPAIVVSQSFSPRGVRIGAELFSRFLSLFSPASGSEVQSRRDEAEHVRSLARRVEATDPGFAADLYAAAARHEGYDA